MKIININKSIFNNSFPCIFFGWYSNLSFLTLPPDFTTDEKIYDLNIPGDFFSWNYTSKRTTWIPEIFKRPMGRFINENPDAGPENRPTIYDSSVF